MTPKRRAAIIAAAISVAAPMEGLRQYAYYDPAGILTVCYGHTGPDVVKGKKYDVAQCKALLEQDMAEAVDIVDRCVPGLPDGVLIAFGDAVFNLGGKIACNKNASTAARLLAAGDLEGACKQLPRWNKASVGGVMVALPGLTKRRLLEETVCLDGLKEAA